MADIAMRPFTATVNFPGKKPFMIGTFFAKPGDKEHDKDALVLAEVTRFWGDHMPDGMPLPNINKTDWGQVFFVPEEH